MLIVHFIGLTMGLGTSFAHMFLGMASSKMAPEEAQNFLLKTLVLSRMGHIGLGLLIISGLYLMTPYWQTLSTTPLLMIKLSLVALLIVLIVLITIAGNKAKNGDANNQLKKMKSIGQLTFITALLIVIVAVSIFH
jgi:uncharacterized membrane protein